ncbi:MAG: hypothetical protein IPK16_01240 [Anaerolineales bacterium]|nr:hypothetical protein [Anaerolineales bacterium]
MPILFAPHQPRAVLSVIFVCVVAALLVAGCGGIAYERLDKAAVDAAVVSATESMLLASKNRDMNALAATRRQPNGAPIDLKQAGCTLKQNHAFFDYDTWEVLGGGVDASGKHYKIDARLNFTDGQHNNIFVFLHEFDDGWKVVNFLPDFHYWCP